MLKYVRKIVTALNLILFFLCLGLAIHFICFAGYSGLRTSIAVADESQTGAITEKTQIPVPSDISVPFNGYAWDPGESLTRYYKFIKFTDDENNDVTETGAKDAGVYTVTIAPADGCEWADGSEEKSFRLTIEKATLEWWYKETNRHEAINNEAYAETTYFWSFSNNRIYDVWAFLGSKRYDKSAPYNNLIILKDGDSNPILKQVINAGTYKFTVEDADNYQNPTFTLVINPARKNIAEASNLKWVLKSSRYTELNSGRVYEYSYNEAGSTEVKKFYSASEIAKAPEADWENWTDVSSSTENQTITAYHFGLINAIKLNNDSGSNAFFSVDTDADGEPDYVGNTAGEPGRYEAEAHVIPIPNYTLYYAPEEADNAVSGMTVVDNNDGSYTVKKVWYVVQYLNEYVDRSSAMSGNKEEYTFPTEWTFGELPEGGIFAPCVLHGDEILMSKESGYNQPNGYALNVDLERILSVLEGVDENGEAFYEIKYYDGTEGWQDGSKDIVTFTITSGDKEICKDQPRSKFAFYVNEFMPVGNYSITFTSKSVSFSGDHVDWWSGAVGTNCGSAYFGTSVSFNFEVKTATCIYDDLDINFSRTDKKPFEVDFASIDGDYYNFFRDSEGKTFVEGAITKRRIEESETYWAEVADEYFDERPYLTFSLVMGSEIYLPATDAEWFTQIANVDTYRVYYQINMRNYYSEYVTDGNKYFDVILYEVLEIPVFVVAEYTGEEQKVLPEVEDSRYTIEGNVQAQIGEYTATLTIIDPVHYRWKDIDGAVCEVGFSIGKATNVWIKEPNLGDYQWNAFDRAINKITADPLVSTPEFGVSYDAEGINCVVGLEKFTLENGVVTAEVEAVFNTLKAGTYYLLGTTVETDTHKPIEKAAYSFNVELAENGWTVEPDIVSWTDNQTPNLPTATPKYGTVTFKIVAEDENTVYYDSANGIDKLAGLKAGTYILIANVDGTTDTYKGIQAKKSFVIYNSLTDILFVFLYIVIALLACAVIILVIILIIKRRKYGKGGEDMGGDGNHTGPEGGAPEAEEGVDKQISFTDQGNISAEQGEAGFAQAQPEYAQPQSAYGQPVYDIYGRKVGEVYSGQIYGQPVQTDQQSVYQAAQTVYGQPVYEKAEESDFIAAQAAPVEAAQEAVKPVEEQAAPVEATQEAVEPVEEQAAPVEATQEAVEPVEEQVAPVEAAQEAVEPVEEQAAPVEAAQEAVEPVEAAQQPETDSSVVDSSAISEPEVGQSEEDGEKK